MSTFNSAAGSGAKKRKRVGNVMQGVPKIKIINWQNMAKYEEIEFSDPVLVREGKIYSKGIVEHEIKKAAVDEEGDSTTEKIGDAWVHLNEIKIVARSFTDDDGSEIPPSLLAPPAVTLPFLVIRFEINIMDENNVDFAKCIYLYCLVSALALDDLLPETFPVHEIDSNESIKRVVSYLLGSETFYQYLKPYLDEFGISKSAITPYTLVF